MKVNDTIEIITKIYELGEKAPTLNLIGKPGVGKSAAVYQAAVRLGERLGLDRPVPVADIRLIYINPVDLRGLPYPDLEKGLAVWLKSGLLPSLEQYGDHLILFWDELTSAPPTVQAAAFQVVWERRLGDWKMAPNWIQVVAGNRLTDRGVTYKMPTPLANRMVHLEVEADLDSWKSWALGAGIDSRVIGFLNFRPQLLATFNPEQETTAFASPRSWEILSNLLGCFPDLEAGPAISEVVRGTVGAGVGAEFLAFCRTLDKVPDPEEILNGRGGAVPLEPDILAALCAALVTALFGRIGDNQLPACLENFLVYTSRLPEEFAVLAVRDALRSPELASALSVLPAWLEWAEKFRKYLL